MKTKSTFASKLVARFTLTLSLALLCGFESNAQWTTSGTNIFNSNTGNVGIGNTAPSNKLDVTGNTRISNNLFLPGTLRANSGTGSQIIKIAATSSSSTGLALNRPGTGFYDWRMINEGGIFKIQIDTGEFNTTSTDAIRINLTGNVSIGTTSSTYKLNVCGTIRATELRLETGWCDYVFADDYKLRPIKEVEEFIKINKHLPDVEPASEVETNGLKVASMSAQMMRKIEELTLYVIDQEKRIAALESENEKLRSNSK
jgi:hypothetical protein